jgi:hypothetical protein
MLFGRHREGHRTVVPPQETEGILSAKKAKAHARDGFLDAVDSGIEARQVVDRVGKIHKANHFGPDIERAMRSWRGDK